MKAMVFAIVLIGAGMLFNRTEVWAQDSTKASQPSHELQVVDARLGKDVKDRMIADEDSVFAKGSKVFLWMKLTGGASDNITVEWKTGSFTHNTTLVVGGSPWRTWASKTASKSGQWTVVVTDGSGRVLKEVEFRVE